MRPRRLLAVTALMGVLVACGGEEPILDDGSQGLPLAGQAAALETAGVEVVSEAAPAGASGAEVSAALEAQDLASDEVDELADGDPVAGLVTARGDLAEFVVLVFDGPTSAALYADDTDGALTPDGDPETYLAGNLVAVTLEHGALVRRALRDLAGEG